MSEMYTPVCQTKTAILDSLDEGIFHHLAQDLSDILGYYVRISITRAKGEWIVNFSGTGRLMNFNFGLYEKGNTGRWFSDNIVMDRPTLIIYNLFILPQGKGFGTKIIRLFLDLIKVTPFKRIILMPQDSAAAGFWSKFLFKKYPIKSRKHFMFLDLEKG